ncbi:MAG: hypothetical protein C0469_00015 [Cyanobacteria bacterium DS2.3.42]|nr:hypothetical protein [Cyanobacteria bacterium DS2.3.42]
MSIMKLILICLIAIVALLAALCVAAYRIASLMACAGGDMTETQDSASITSAGSPADIEGASASLSNQQEQMPVRAAAK